MDESRGKKVLIQWMSEELKSRGRTTKDDQFSNSYQFFPIVKSLSGCVVCAVLVFRREERKKRQNKLILTSSSSSSSSFAAHSEWLAEVFFLLLLVVVFFMWTRASINDCVDKIDKRLSSYQEKSFFFLSLWIIDRSNSHKKFTHFDCIKSDTADELFCQLTSFDHFFL